MCESHDIVDDYCSNHVLNMLVIWLGMFVCRNLCKWLCFSFFEGMQVIVLKVGFGSNCGLLWILENWWRIHESKDWIHIFMYFNCSFSWIKLLFCF